MKHIDDAARLAAAIFAFQGWTYTLATGDVVPDRKELANTITYLLRAAANSGGPASTGRLYVVWNEDFNQYEIMLEIGRLTSRELYEEAGIDIMAKADTGQEED